MTADGFPVVYTRTEDVYQRPIDKARIANENEGDYFVSFHRNSSPQRNTYSGVQTLVYADEGIKAELARNINRELSEVGFNDLGVPERTNLVVLKRTNMPAVLIETGFINTDADNELFDTRFDDIANAIARAIEETVGDSNNSAVENDGVLLADNSMGNTGRTDEETMENRGFGVQVGLYSRYENALYQAMELERKGYNVRVINRRPFYAVVVGREDDLDDAAKLERKLESEGYDTLIINI